MCASWWYSDTMPKDDTPAARLFATSVIPSLIDRLARVETGLSSDFVLPKSLESNA